MKRKVYLIVLGLLIYSLNGFSISRLDFNFIASANDTPVAKNNWVYGSFNGVRMASSDTIYFFADLFDSVVINFLENDYDPDGSIDSASVEILFVSPVLPFRLLPTGHLSLKAEFNEVYFGYMDYRVRDDSGLFSNTARIFFEMDIHGGLENAIDKEDIKLSPNPAHEQFILDWESFSTYKSMEMFLIDLNGRVVLKETIRSERTELDTSHLPNGTYLLKFIMDSEIVKMDKLIIQHP